MAYNPLMKRWILWVISRGPCHSIFWGENNFIYPMKKVPPKLLPKNVREVVKVCILVGQFLRPLPDPSPCAGLVVEQGSAKGGRPRKGTAHPAKRAAGRFAGQSARDAEHQIQLLQKDWVLRCIPKTSFVRLAKDALSNLVPKNLDFDPKLTSSIIYRGAEISD